MTVCIRFFLYFQYVALQIFTLFLLWQSGGFSTRKNRQNPKNPPPPKRRHWWSWQCHQRRSCVWCPLCPWKWRRHRATTRRPSTRSTTDPLECWAGSKENGWSFRVPKMFCLVKEEHFCAHKLWKKGSSCGCFGGLQMQSSFLTVPLSFFNQW